jgi:hypothetical protein
VSTDSYDSFNRHTECSTVLLKKLTVTQKKFPAIYANCSLTAEITTAHHKVLFWAIKV